MRSLCHPSLVICPRHASHVSWHRALSSATDSGDPNLVYLALFHLYRHMPLQDLLDLLATRPYARNLFLTYCQRQEPALLEQLYAAMGTVEGVAQIKVCVVVDCCGACPYRVVANWCIQCHA